MKVQSVPRAAVDSPAEGSDAGSDADLRAAYFLHRIEELRGLAERRWANAKRLRGQGGAASEREARAAIDAAVRAFWWAEGSGDEDGAHELMHEIGRWTRQEYGCFLAFEEGRYKQRCPIAIAHRRLGMSVAFIAKRHCSICDGDLSECPHQQGRTYWVRGGGQQGRACAVCLDEECEHSPDWLYRVAVVSIVRNVDEIREISVVSRPAQPEARLLELPVNSESLRRHFGAAFVVGMSVSCDQCLGACPGFHELPTDA